MFNIALEETLLEYPSKDGNAIAIIFTGCPHHCIGCHSPNLQKDEDYFEDINDLIKRIEIYAKRANTNKLVITGGDCLYLKNLDYTRQIVDKLNKNYDICIYTGYDIDYVKKLNLNDVKYYKCGKFDYTKRRDSEKTDFHFILASPNQNFYDGNYNLLSENGILKF